MLLFSGFFIKLNELPLYFQPFTYISFFRFGVEGSVQSIYYNRTNLECPTVFCYYKNVDKFLEDIGMENNNYYMCVGGIIAWIIILQIFLYAALKYKSKKHI